MERHKEEKEEDKKAIIGEGYGLGNDNWAGSGEYE